MSDIETAIVVAEVRYVPVYVCNHCAHTQRGGTVTRTVSAFGFQGLNAQIDAFTLRPYDMPVGWSHDYPDIYRCPKCRGA